MEHARIVISTKEVLKMVKAVDQINVMIDKFWKLMGNVQTVKTMKDLRSMVGNAGPIFVP